MKTLLLSTLLSFGLASAQVYVEHTFPHSIQPGQQKVVDLNLCKPAAKEFMQYELAFQPGIQITEVSSAGGHFVADKNSVKLIWALGTGTACTKVRVTVTAVSSGTIHIAQKLEYEFRGERKVAIIEELKLVVGQEVAEEPVTVRRSNQVVPGNLPLSRVDSIERTMKDPVQAAKHVAELRKDAREARLVGERETREADLEIAEATRALAQAKQNPDEKVRQTLVKEAEDRMQHATMNLQIAQKIISLAQTLEKNANDIEAAGKASQTAVTPTLAEGVKNSNAEVEDLKKMFSKPSQGGDAILSAGADTLFHIQLGAFGQQPAARDYKNAGKVNIINENGLYKVLVGGFKSREEAIRRREELAVSGYEGFIVRYAGKRRVY